MWVEEKSNGRFKFVEQFTDPMTGKKKRVSITLEKNTAKFRRLALEELNRKIKALQNSTADTITLADLVEKYRLYQQQTVKPSTYRRNYYSCITILSILGNDILVNQLTAQYIKERFLKTGKKAGTMNELRIRFSALIRWGFENDYISDITFLSKFKPFKDIPHRLKIKDKYLERTDVKKLLNSMSPCGHWKYLTEFLLLTGLRFGEAAALKVSDIDMKNKVIHINKTYDCNNKIVTSTKTECSTRELYIQPELDSLIHEIMLYMKEQKFLRQCNNDLFFIGTGKRNCIDIAAYNKYLKKSSFKALGFSITSHTLRHTHASLLLEQGIGIETISRRLGHENSKVTQKIYLHVTQRLRENDNLQLSSIKII